MEVLPKTWTVLSCWSSLRDSLRSQTRPPCISTRRGRGSAGTSLKWLVISMCASNVAELCGQHTQSCKTREGRFGVRESHRVRWRLTGQLLQSLVGRVLNPGQVKDIPEVTAAMEN